MNTRTEHDSVGALQIPAGSYYGVHSLRGFQNFRITKKTMHPCFITNIVKIKKAAAITNKNASCLDARIASAIIQACDEIIGGKLLEQFIVDPIQGGAGTSANMNSNEVIANRAIELLDGVKGDYSLVHPNDHVNMSQSTNDVFPTAGKLTVLTMLSGLIVQLNRLYEALLKKSDEFDDIIKIGRTQLQYAVPVRLGQSFRAFAMSVKRDIFRINRAKKEDMSIINMGGTAIGTTINTAPEYQQNIAKNIEAVTGFKVIQAMDLIDATQNLDSFVNVSGIIRVCAVNLSKMANDLRLLSMPDISEINLPARQNGSSIMPGKINPVIPEVVSQVAFNIIGNDTAITLAAGAGQLELNAFEPILFYNLFESIETLEGAVQTFVDNCVIGITANEKHCKELVENSTSIITALSPNIGYTKAAELVKVSLETGIPVKELIINNNLLCEDKVDIMLNLYNMT